MKTSKIIGIGTVCFVAAFAIAVIVTNSLGEVIENQQERNYQRFVSNMDGLTNTFREPIEGCVQKEMQFQDNVCVKGVIEEYQIQFGTLIKLFGYESNIEELYKYWLADLEFWYDSKKIEQQYFDQPDLLNSELERLSNINEEAVKARTDSEFAFRVESK